MGSSYNAEIERALCTAIGYITIKTVWGEETTVKDIKDRYSFIDISIIDDVVKRLVSNGLVVKRTTKEGNVSYFVPSVNSKVLGR